MSCSVGEDAYAAAHIGAMYSTRVGAGAGVEERGRKSEGGGEGYAVMCARESLPHTVEVEVKPHSQSDMRS